MAEDAGPPEVPYPAHWEADVALRTGAVIHIRPIRPDDAPALQRFHRRQSPESTYFRFFAPIEQLSEAELHRLTEVDHHDRVALVLVDGSEIVAVGRFDRIGEDAAEVAFNVADGLQGRGLGSVLLEHLAAAAHERGIRRFAADVLPANARMLRVFADAGYDIRQAYDDGVVTVAFDIDPTERSRAVMAEREAHADARSMWAVLAASSVVLVAEGPDADLARRAAEHVTTGGFAGPVHLVGAVLRDLPGAWHRTVAELGGPVDLAVVAAPEERLPALARELSEHRVRALTVLSGPSPAGAADAATRHHLLRAARDGGMRLVGPESFGVVALGEAGRLNASLRRDLPPDGGVSLFCQSAVAGRHLLDEATRRHLPLATFLSAGHRADVSGNDTLQFWAGHEPTRVGCVWLESIGNARKLSRVARRLAGRVPVVVALSGATGQVVPPGHAVRTSGEPRQVLDELLRQAGVIRARDAEEMLDIAQLLVAQPRPGGRRIAIVADSGSLASLAHDAAQDEGLTVTSAAWLGATASPSAFEAALAAVAGRVDWDALLVACAPPLGSPDPGVATAVARTGAAGERPVLGCIAGLVGLTEELRGPAELDGSARGVAAGPVVPAFATVQAAVRALAAVTRHAEARMTRGVPAVPTGTDPRRAHALVRDVLGETGPRPGAPLAADRVGELLACYGIGVDALPVLRPEHGVECVVRAVEDDLYGPVVAFGVAGDATELFGDFSYRVPPLTDVDVREMVRSVRAAPRLVGGGAVGSVDVAALEDVLARVAALKDDLPEVLEMVLAPVVVRARGVCVRGARVTLGRPARVDGGRRVLPGEATSADARSAAVGG